MAKTLYVSNVGEASNLCAIEDLFTTVGDVDSRHVELIPESGHQLGFGVFEMSTEQQASDCVERFNGASMNGRQLAVVTERPKARPKSVPTTKRKSKK